MLVFLARIASFFVRVNHPEIIEDVCGLQQTVGFVVAFVSIMIVSAAYYVASRSLAPPPRRGRAEDPYYSGSPGGGPITKTSLPYPWLVLLFASIEAVPLAVLVSAYRGSLCVLALLVAVVLGEAVVLEVVRR